MQLNAQGLAALDAARVEDYAVVDAGNGVAALERGGGTQSVQPGDLELHALTGELHARAHAPKEVVVSTPRAAAGVL